MTRRYTAVLVAAFLVVAGLAGATGGVTAASNDSWTDGFTDDDPDDLGSTIIASAKGGLAATQYWVSSIDVPVVGGSSTTDTNAAANDAQAVQEYFNNHSSEFVNYTNNRTSPSSEWNVFEVTFKRGDSTETVYLIANISSDGTNYTSAQIVDNTSRTVDKTAVLRGYASKNARKELEQFHEDFVKPNESVSQAYLARMYSQYNSYVEAPFLLGGDN